MPESISGVGNVVAGRDIRDNTIEVTNIFNNITVNSPVYNEWKRELKKTEKLLAITPTDDPERETYANDVEELKKKIISFEELALSVAKKLFDPQVDSERVNKARSFIEAGDLEGAQTVLDKKEIKEEFERVKTARQKKQESIEEDENKMKELAAQMLLKAEVTLLQYENPQRITMAEECYKESVSMVKYYSNLEGYADFLAKYGTKDDEMSVYVDILKLGDQVRKIDRVRILHNMAWIYGDQGNYDKVIDCYDEINSIGAFDKPTDQVISMILSLNALENATLQTFKKDGKVDRVKLQKLFVAKDIMGNLMPDTDFTSAMLPLYVRTLFRVSEIFLEQGEVAEGEKYFEQSIHKFKIYLSNKPVYPPLFQPKDLALSLANNLLTLNGFPAVDKAKIKVYLNDLFEITQQYESLVKEHEENESDLYLSLSMTYRFLATIAPERQLELLKKAFSFHDKIELVRAKSEYLLEVYRQILLLDDQQDGEYVYKASVGIQRHFAYIGWETPELINFRDAINTMVESAVESEPVSEETINNKENSSVS